MLGSARQFLAQQLACNVLTVWTLSIDNVLKFMKLKTRIIDGLEVTTSLRNRNGYIVVISIMIMVAKNV